MEIKMNRDDVVANYGGDVEESGFEKAAFEAAIVTLGEKVPGWHTYEVNSKDNVSPLIRHEVELLDEADEVVHTVTIDTTMNDEEVLIWNNSGE